MIDPDEPLLIIERFIERTSPKSQIEEPQHLESIPQQTLTPATPATAVAAVKPTPARASARSISIRKGIAAPTAPITEYKVEQAERVVPNDADLEPISEEQSVTESSLDRGWRIMLETMGPNHKLYQTLSLYPPVLIDGNVILLTVDNPIQVNEIQSSATGILTYLRKTVANSHISLQAELKKEGEGRRYKTPQEWFNDMIEKNPAIGELKEALGLELLLR